MPFPNLPTLALLTTAASASYPGIATFNDYSAQSNTVCGPKSGSGGTYGAAAGDISPDIWFGGRCAGTVDDYSKCNGQMTVNGYTGPSCPQTTCGTCYRVCNNGGVDGASVGGVGNCISVTLIDVCPAESAYNYCKTQVPANQRCGDPNTNALDIDEAAYFDLTGTGFYSGVPNLQILIDPC